LVENDTRANADNLRNPPDPEGSIIDRKVESFAYPVARCLLNIRGAWPCLPGIANMLPTSRSPVLSAIEPH
jgi:hypothetical protein